MHIACQNKSKLRYYLVKHYPSLLKKKDIGGKLPLHIACKNNDTLFISWLLGTILTRDDGNVHKNLKLSLNIRARSMSDDLSLSSATSPSNSSQVLFPQSPVDVVSTNPIVAHAQSSDYCRGNGDHCNEDDRIFAPPHSSSASEQDLTFSYNRNRSSSTSTNEYGRSTSSERSSPSEQINESVVQNSGSISPDDKAELCSNETHENCKEVSTSGNGPCGDINYDTDPAVHKRSRPKRRKGVNKAKNFSILMNSEHTPDDLCLRPLLPAEINALLDYQNIVSKHPLSVADILDIDPFCVDKEGDTIFHILARNNHFEVLTYVVKVADALKYCVKLDMLTSREGFYSMLPIEEALHVKSHECVRKLIHLTMAADLMPELLQQAHILKCAVFVNDIQLVRILIENGFHQGLKPAISLAILSEYHDILRILLFWQTQVVNSLEFSRVKRIGCHRMMTLDHGGVKWEEIQLESVHHQWITDAVGATNSVAKLLRSSCIDTELTDKNYGYFKSLGAECLQYFDNLTYSLRSKRLQVPLAPITEVNISENQLKHVPVELFQMQHLRVLRLSHNALTQLPSSPAFTENIYTSQLAVLDLDWNELRELPEDMFRGLSLSLRQLSVQYNQLEHLPPGIWVMPKLKMIKLAHNKLETLHTLSRSCYFNDRDMSMLVLKNFEVDENGVLKCNSNKDSLEIQQCTEYLNSLANFYLTVCAAQGHNASLTMPSLFQQILDLHSDRCYKLQHSNSNSNSVSEQESATLLHNPQILRIFEEEEHLMSAIKCTMDLEFLDLSYNSFKYLPWDLACIAPKLQKLDLRGNALREVDILHSFPSGLHSLVLVQNKLVSLNEERSVDLPCGNPMLLLCNCEDLVAAGYCQHCSHSTLELLSNLILDHNRLDHFPIIGVTKVQTPDIVTGFTDYDIILTEPHYPNLSILSLANNKFSTVPKYLHRLIHLSSLNLSFNNIVELPLDMGLMNGSCLLLLKLDGLMLRKIPDNLLTKPKQLLNHLKALKQK